jgi:SAM-dependent methyltransferase
LSGNNEKDLDSLGSPDRFGYEWDYFDNLIPEYEEQFKRWVSVLEKESLEGLYVVDAGCGTGRNSYWMRQRGAERVLAFDVEPMTVKVAERNLNDFGNIQVSCMSIYEACMPSSDLADIVFSIGVVHHLADPVKAISNLSKLAKPNGLVVIWVYGREGNEWILWFLDPLRKITKHIPMPILNAISNLLAYPLFAYLRLPFPKSKYLKLISSFRYWHLKSIVLDQLLPKIANYWTENEVRELMEDSGLRDIKVKSVNGMSWSVSGQV